VARIFVLKKIPKYFYDESALSLEKYIPDQTILKKSSEYYLLESVARCFNIEEMSSAFIKTNGECNIVSLGASLDTFYYRLNVERPTFYEIAIYGIEV
jgi:O-methyltransferase involved in polyketide biosynthesis